MPTRVYLLRHAESSAPHVFNGLESDVELSKLGHKQAQAIAPVIASYNPQVIISSGMKRAMQTATPIAQACGLSLQVETSLHERRVGSLSGQRFQKNEGPWHETRERWIQGDTAFTFAGAESFDEIRDRVLPVWDRLTTEYAGKTLTIIAHGVVCKVLLLTLNPKWTVANWNDIGAIKNVGIHELVQRSAQWEVVRLNEVVPEVAQLVG